MRIALIQAPFYPSIIPSLGLGYIRAVLVRAGHTVTVIDLNDLTNQEDEFLRFWEKIQLEKQGIEHLRDADFATILNNGRSELTDVLSDWARKILATKPDVVGFSLYSISVTYSVLLSQTLKEMTDVTIVCGGPALQDPLLLRSLNELKFLDHLIIGEGDYTLRDLLEKRLHDKIIYAQPPELDSLPYPLIDRSELATKEAQSIMPIALSRGCNHTCTFCDLHCYYGTYRQRDIQKVVHEMKSQMKHGIDSFWFCDALLNALPQNLPSLAREIVRNNLEVYWGGYASLDSNFTTELCNTLQKSGCRFLRFGIESGSSRVLKHMRKSHTPALALQVCKSIYDEKIHIRASFIVGYPTESNEDFLETFKLLIALNDRVNAYVIYEYRLEPTLEETNPLKHMDNLPSQVVAIRYAIANLFTRSHEHQITELYLTGNDHRVYHQPPISPVFIRPLLFEGELYEDRPRTLGAVEIAKLSLAGAHIDHTGGKQDEKREQPIMKDGRSSILPPPLCIQRQVSGCENCIGFLKVVEGKLLVCRNLPQIRGLLKGGGSIKKKCVGCIYLRRNQCPQCNHSDDAFIPA
jgi:tRNA A37 methylthiotransferase MiaB